MQTRDQNPGKTNAPALMRAVQLTGPVEPSQMRVSEIPLPQVKPGWVRVKVKAFGINQSETVSRRGLSDPDFTFPRVLGIEGVGLIDAVAPNSCYQPGQQVAFMMGGLGREYDGSYAQYTLVPESILIPFKSDLDWVTLGAIPEMTQTAYGSLIEAMRAKPGDTVLVRGATSSVGLMALGLANWLGVKAVATTRRESSRQLLLDAGAQAVVIDDGTIAPKVRELYPQGVDSALELVGLNVLADTLRCVRRGGMVSFTGSLSEVWVMDKFAPFEILPSTVGLTVYHGHSQDLPAEILQQVYDAVACGQIKVPLGQVFHGLEQVGLAHEAMQLGGVKRAKPGKNVVVLD